MFLGLEESEDNEFSVSGIKNPPKVIKELWDGLNNKEKVSVNILSDSDVQIIELEGKKVIKINIPRATRFQMPVCQLALLVANGKLMMIFWFAIADDFDVTKWNFTDFPTDFASVSEQQRTKLLAIAPKLEEAMEAAVQYKLNAGRKVGNYNLAKCRDVTDQSDHILAEALGFADVWEDIELYYAQTMKTDFSDDDE